MNISPSSISLIQSQMQGSLMSSTLNAGDTGSWASIFSFLVSNGSSTAPSSSDPLSLLTQSNPINQSGGINGLSAVGRNMLLADPESAYNMMTLINNKDDLYKAQFAELSQIKADVSQMQVADQSLGGITPATGNDSIQSRLQNFVGQYNDWIKRVTPDIQQGGLLSDTQAAQASQFELEQNVNNPLFGAADGVHGLSDLGITIDPNTRLASLDTSKLNSILTANKQGVVDTVQEFSANFAKSANLLNSDGNFILKQLDNLNRAIHYIDSNKTSLQAEFGTGNAAQPTGQVAQAAVYHQTYGA